MASPPEYVEFRPDAPEEVVSRMRAMMSTRRGWMNLQPGIPDDEEVRARSGGLFGFLSAQGPPVPVCTFAPADRSRREGGQVSLGIQHGAGPKAAKLLAERDHGVPQGWFVLQDHPRRGLVLAVPGDVDPAAVLSWAITAAELLTTATLTGDWRAAFYEGRG